MTFQRGSHKTDERECIKTVTVLAVGRQTFNSESDVVVYSWVEGGLREERITSE